MAGRWIVVVLGLVLALGAGTVPADAQTGERRLLIFEGADYAGFDFETREDVTLDACKAACLQERSCKAFTYNTKVNWCFLKSDFGELTEVEDAVAGRVASGTAPIAETPSIDLSFLPDGMVSEAKRFRENLARAADGAGSGFADARAGGRAALVGGDPRRAVALLRRALALNGEDSALWRDLARAYLAIEPKDYTERYQLPEAASAASLSGLQVADSTERRAAMLSILAQALERRELWRPAIETYRASLAVQNNARVRAAFERVRSAHGFRMLDYAVDSEGAEPRVCIQFSEDLAKSGVEFSDYVIVDAVPSTSVTRETRQICVDGLEHGQRYRIGLRAGLPSAVGEVLESAADISVYVRDRSPTVRFTGRNYVLPRLGTKGVPLVSVNTRLVHAEIYRIGGRGLVQALSDGGFLDQISGYRAARIAEERGERVWKGEMPVEFELNREVVTAFPVSDALPAPEPGVYVLSTRADGAADNEWEERATQWFIVSDLGLATLDGSDGLNVFVRSLATAKAHGAVALTLLARNNEILGTATTGIDGHVRFAPGLTRGEGGSAPAVIIAETGDDYAFLDLTKQPFDLGDRGVGGRPAPGPVDVYAFTERGVYRPGATVHLVAMMRDASGTAISGVPLTLIVERPDGVEYRRTVLRDDAIGAFAYDLALAPDVVTGTWRFQIHSDPEAPALSETKFLVEDFIPERLDFEVEAAAATAQAGQPLDVSLTGRFLYGAPASGLSIEGEAEISTVRTAPSGLEGYRFGLDDETVVPLRRRLDRLPVTDAEGKASFAVTVPSAPQTTRRLETRVILRLREAGGRAVERSITLPVEPAGPMIGVRPSFKDDQIGEGETAFFDTLAVGPDGAPVVLDGSEWALYRVENRFDWYRLDGRWRYESTPYSERVANGSVSFDGTGPQRIAAPVDYGRYRLEISGRGADAPATSIAFTAGWYSAEASAETPDILDIALDKERYAPGDTASVRIAPRFAGTALVTVMGDGLLAMQAAEIGEEGGAVSFTVDERWGAGVYVTAMLYRPMDADDGLMPARAVGVDWLPLDMDGRTLNVAFGIGETAAPRETLRIPVSVNGLEPGEDARITVAAVDLGILNLTGYQAPDPAGWYHGQRRLGVDVRDLYGQLINGLEGTRGRIRSGSGEAGLSLTGAPPTEAPLALFSGVVTVGEDGGAEIAFEIPAFNGTVRLMATVWSAGKLGAAQKDIVVRDPVVLTASLPRFLAPGDRSRLRMDIDNVDGPAGAWDITVETDGPMAVDRSGIAEPVVLDAGERRALDLPISAAAIGRSTLTVSLSHPSGIALEKTINLAVRPAQPVTSRRRSQVLAAGEDGLTLSPQLVADFVPGSASVNVTVARGVLLDIPGLLDSLDRYPYGCAEQVTSRALPLLYVSEVAEAAGLSEAGDTAEKVRSAIASVLQRQDSNGAFGLWRAAGSEVWLDAYVTDFLTRAREAGHDVPKRAFDAAVDRLENLLSYAGDVTDGGQGTAYALYVLARNRRASIGDLRYYVDAKLDAFSSALAKAQLGAALARYGDTARAQKAFAAAFTDLRADDGDEDSLSFARGDYGSRVRDAAATLALAAEAANANIILPPIIRVLERVRDAARYASTQEQAWLLLAAAAMLGEDEAVALEVNGAAHSGRLMRQFTQKELAGSVAIRNLSETDLEAMITVRGVPKEALPPSSNGLSVERRYYTLDGEAAATAEVAQNQRLVAVLRIVEPRPRKARLLVEDFLPAGFEIDNPRLLESGSTERFSWLGQTSFAEHVEFRDDRFVAAFDRPGSQAETLTLAYVVRAVSPGRFVHPPARVEDMYRPEINARTATDQVEVFGPRPR